MPAAARVGDSVNTGHLCSTTTTIQQGDSTVLIGGRPAAYNGSLLSPHTIESQRGVQPPGPPTNPSTCIPHTANVTAGSSTVFVGGKQLARRGDRADDGTITGGADNVVVG